MSTIGNEVDALDAIAECANGEGFTKEVVEGLARFFRSVMTFRANEIGEEDQGVVETYWVAHGYLDYTYTGPHDSPITTRERIIGFLSTFREGCDDQRQLQPVFVVPTRRVSAAAPLLVKSILNVQSPADGPKVVITAPLQGCTFAIGVAGNAYFMSHAQPVTSDADATGVALAWAIHGRSQRFEGPETPRSTFLIYPGNTIDEGYGYGYGNPQRGDQANVMGLVVKDTNTLS